MDQCTKYRGINALRTLILPLVLLLIVDTPLACGEETIAVNKTLNGREIKVRTGGTIRVELEQLGAAGYTWEPQNLDKEYFEILSVKTSNPEEKKDIVGASVLKTWDVKAIKSGKSRLKFLYYRPWEGEESAVDTFVLNVRILGTQAR